MRIILRADIEGLGFRGDLVEVADGYARNFLIPHDLGFVATDGAIRQSEAMRRSRETRDATDRAAAEDVARGLVSATIVVTAKAGSEGKLFGSVTAADIAHAVNGHAGLEVDRKSVHLDEPIKEVGPVTVQLRLHREVEIPLNVEVVAG